MADRVAARRGLPSPHADPTAASSRRFPDGAHFRVEIPSVENLRVVEAVLAAARDHEVVVNRVSQEAVRCCSGSPSCASCRRLGSRRVEISLFVGPREGFGVGAHARSADGSAHAGQIRGMRGLAYAVEDVARACEAGIRSFLVADQRLLTVVVDMQVAGELPAECGWKISVVMAPSNPAALVVLERLGATTVNGGAPRGGGSRDRPDQGRARRGRARVDRSAHPSLVQSDPRGGGPPRPAVRVRPLVSETG